MNDTSAVLAGQCSPWPTTEDLVRCLTLAGLAVNQGKYSVRVTDCSHFVFQHLGGDIAIPTIDADAENSDALLRDARLVSEALAAADVRHRFEIYDFKDQRVGYLHHNWPENG